VTDYEFPKVPEIDAAYRAAHRALRKLVEANGHRVYTDLEDDDEHFIERDALPGFPSLVDQAQLVTASHIGPRASWTGPRREGDWTLVQACVDLDGGLEDKDDEVQFEKPYYADEWTNGPMGRAARAYQRECGWDFAPGEAGIWLLALAPTSGFGGSDPSDWHYSGYLVGFVILYDRDEDGTHESVGHVWTARAWRRRGIARDLLATARSRFDFRHFDGPATDSGAGLIKATTPAK
jgi:ribosomal protein S18 acetylase RimI-like enzyme